MLTLLYSPHIHCSVRCFRLIRKISKIDYYLHYVCPSIWNNLAATGWIFLCNFTLSIFRKPVEKI